MNDTLTTKTLLEAPIYPEDWECCDNGCGELCVYEIYRVQKQAYDEQQATLKDLPSPNPNASS